MKPDNNYKVGDSAEITHVFTAREVDIFAELSGDKNPVHLDEAYASRTQFKGRIVHGMLVSSLFSTIFGTVFPGEGSIYLGQNLRFTAPVKLGAEVKARVTISAIRPDKPIATFETVCSVGDQVVVSGDATILLPA